MLIVFFVIALCGLGEFGVEARLKVFFEDLTIIDIDRKYMDPEKTVVYIVDDEETGENTISSTLAIVKKLPADAEARLSLTGMSMGKYTVPTGVDLKMTLCEMLDEPIIMGPFFSVLGFSRDTCPPGPGIYSQEGYKLPLDDLPDEFPENKYLAYIAISIKGKPLIGVNIYANIEAE